MKLLTIVVAAGIVAATANAQVPGSGIVGSVHDFSTAGWNTTKAGEICGVCHIPHVKNRPPDQIGNPLLWGRTMSTQTYTVYTSPSLDGAITPPDGTSKLCLSCHDGTVALEHFSGVFQFFL